MKMLRKLRQTLRRAKHRVRAWCRWAIRRATDERGYAEAVVLLGVEFADLFFRSKALRRLSRKAALTVLVVLRALLRSDDVYPETVPI